MVDEESSPDNGSYVIKSYPPEFSTLYPKTTLEKSLTVVEQTIANLKIELDRMFKQISANQALGEESVQTDRCWAMQMYSKLMILMEDIQRLRQLLEKVSLTSVLQSSEDKTVVDLLAQVEYVVMSAEEVCLDVNITGNQSYLAHSTAADILYITYRSIPQWMLDERERVLTARNVIVDLRKQFQEKQKPKKDVTNYDLKVLEENMVEQLNRLVPQDRWKEYSGRKEKQKDFMKAMFHLQESIKIRQEERLQAANGDYLMTNQKRITNYKNSPNVVKPKKNINLFGRSTKNPKESEDKRIKRTIRKNLIETLEAYLRGEKIWTEVTKIYQGNEHHIDEEAKSFYNEIDNIRKSHTFSLDFTSDASNKIKETLIKQIEKYVSSKKGTSKKTIAKKKVMEALKIYLEGKDEKQNAKQWQRIETLLTEYAGLYDAGSLYSQVKETVKAVKELKERLWDTKFDAVFEKSLNSNDVLNKDELLNLIVKHHNTYQLKEEKSIFESIKSYLNGDPKVPWIYVCHKMEKNPNWKNSQTLKMLVEKIETKISDAKEARRCFNAVTKLENEYREIFNSVNSYSPDEKKVARKVIENILQMKNHPGSPELIDNIDLHKLRQSIRKRDVDQDMKVISDFKNSLNNPFSPPEVAFNPTPE